MKISIVRIAPNSRSHPWIHLCMAAMIGLLLLSCQEDPNPRPRGEIRLDLPEKQYVPMQSDCPFSTRLPTYAFVENARNAQGRCWKNIVIPELKATIYLTYSPIDDDLPRLLKDSRDLTYEHHGKANNIVSEQIIRPEDSVYGLMYELSGDVASNTQFYLTDSTDHFLRGALYFNTRPNWDSLSPVVAFVNEDIRRLIQDLEWK